MSETLSDVALRAGLLAAFVAGAIGAGLAWWIRRRTSLSIRNIYVLAIVLLAALVVAGATHSWIAVFVLAPLVVFASSASLVGRRWRLSDLGAGEELRRYEQRRRWIWQAPPTRDAGERVYIATQGEIVRERPWPTNEPYVPMTAGDDARLPRRAGQHVASFGATGSGKSTSVLRAVAGRVLSDGSALLAVDPKGDPPTETFLRRLASAAGRPFVLFDPLSTQTDRWQPLWGDRPSAVVARVLAGIEKSEPYYFNTLRQHVTLIATVLHASGRWPPSFPFLVEAAQLERYDRVLLLARGLQADHPDLGRRTRDHQQWVESREGKQALKGGLVLLDNILGDAWRSVLEPRHISHADGPAAVSVAATIRAGAIVLWRTHVDEMPDEARAITPLVLADIHASAIHADGKPWTLMLDEFGAIVQTCAPHALALLQRGRTHNGQVHVVTQSIADVEALTGQAGLLDSLSDNFAGFVVHRQTSPDSRDWLAKLMGTTALWQSTDQTSGHGMNNTGAGSRRRVREFRVGSDTFADLRVGEALIYSTYAKPTRVLVDELVLPEGREPIRIGVAERHACEIAVDAARELPCSPPRNAAARTSKPRASPPSRTPPRIVAREIPASELTATREAVSAALDEGQPPEGGDSDLDDI
jgi:TraM recognition site of TraD and TraG/Type IV secretory system Conjugative DNA transfer